MMTLHNKYVYYFTVIAFFIALHTNAQTVTEEWVEFFDLTSNDVTVDDEGNFYITGWALQSGACTDYCTVKYNTYGDLEWSSYYTGTGDYEDVAHSIALDYNDNVIVTGISQDAFTSKDYLTVKYDNDGNEAWVRRYYYTLNDQWDRAYDVAVDEFGGVVVTGQSFSTAGYMGMGNDLCTIKYDALGDTSWISRYDLTTASFPSAESGNCIALDHNNNAVVAGWNTGTGDTVVYDLRTIKYGFSGG
ncbi:hypothetical protein KKA00_11730, partial [bacterium]|nr:hypothetical protein [bacterium]